MKVDAKVELIRVELAHRIEQLRVDQHQGSEFVRSKRAGRIEGLQEGIRILDSVCERVR